MSESDIKIGERVRKIRNERGLTLQDVANFTGFSKALISQIENNVVMPPINTLAKIAKVLNVKMTYFFEEEIDNKDYYIVRKEDRKYIFREGVKYGYLYEGLAEMKGHENVQMFLVTIKAADGQKKLFSHDGVEYMFVLSGKVKVYLGHEEYDMEEGDSVAFNSRIPHYMESLDADKSEIVSVLIKPQED